MKIFYVMIFKTFIKMERTNMSWDRITVSITKEQNKLLNNIVKKEDKNKSAIVRRALDYYFNAHKGLDLKEKLKELEGKVKALEGDSKRK
jgi:hypothetical protein